MTNEVYRFLGTDVIVDAAKSLFRKGDITEEQMKEIEERNEIQDIVDREDVVIIKEGK